MTQVFATYKEHFVKNTTHDTTRDTTRDITHDTGDTDVNSPQRLAKGWRAAGFAQGARRKSGFVKAASWSMATP